MSTGTAAFEMYEELAMDRDEKFKSFVAATVSLFFFAKPLN